jgi:hypothetical protein
MRYDRIMTGVMAAAFATTAALAQDAPRAYHGDMRPHDGDQCIDRQAHMAGELAYLETRLALTGRQVPLFERWKKIRLAGAADCEPPPDGQPGIVERPKSQQAMLRRRLDGLQAELPAIEALAATLTPEQAELFDQGSRRRVLIRWQPEDFGPPPPPPEF